MSPSNPTAPAPTAACLGLGSNLGDRAAHLAAAVAALRADPGTEVVAVSSVYATRPVGPADQPDFLNAAVLLRTTRPPEALLALCLEIEAARGRVRTARWGPRTLDLDLLLYGGERRAGAGLTLPHPRMKERAFVLAPLAEIAPDWRLDGRTIAAWAAAADASGVTRLEAPRLAAG